MSVKINQNYWQRRTSKTSLSRFKFKSRSLSLLNSTVPRLELRKDYISSAIEWYLKNRKKWNVKLDINRKCRALGIPAYISGVNINTPEWDEACKKTVEQLRPFTKKLKSGKSVRPCRVDINELMVYMRMYQEVEYASLLNKDDYQYGNPFDDLITIMDMGAVIIRFKYVKIGNKKPVEKLVSYHLCSNNGLAVHIEGDDHFSMYKNWGEGDEKLKPLDGRNITIRWGINDFNKKGRFTY